MEAVIPETAANAARDEKEIHEVDPHDKKEDAQTEEKDDAKDDEPCDERDDAQDDRKDDPHENVETMEQANIASEDGVDARSKGDSKHELDEEKETLNLLVHGNPEEETARELVEDSPDDPHEPDIVEATEDPDAPHADSTEHPSNEDPVERSSPSHKTDFDIPDLEGISISPGGSLGPEQQPLQKVQPDDRFPDPESKEREMVQGRDVIFQKVRQQVLSRKKNKKSGIWLERFAKTFWFFESDHGGPICIIWKSAVNMWQDCELPS